VTPVRLRLTDGCKLYCYGTSFEEVARRVELARSRGDEYMQLDNRQVRIDRILSVLAPEETTPGGLFFEPESGATAPESISLPFDTTGK
jgi:hypothetical protein